MRTLNGMTIATVILLAAFGYSAAHGQETGPAKISKTAMGQMLADADGMTLYTYSRDMTGYSNCNDACASVWLPMTPAVGAVASGDWSIILRDDGKPQWAYKGQPLYRFSKDAAPGDMTGDSADKGRWHVAKP